jgi:(heptosyl)LPS beta-1,4-glucosyltransferase
MISAVIIARNEAANIERCVHSLLPVADDILVLDTGSSDNTRQLAEAAGARSKAVAWQGYAATKNAGYEGAKYDYILSLDADEALSPDLQQSISSIKKNLQGAYAFNRLTFFGEKPIRHAGWYPDTKVRLFHKANAKWVGEFVHETLELSPGTPVTHLQGDLLHYSIRDAADQWERTRAYAELAARKMHAEGKRYSVFKHWFSPLARFVSMYFLKLGFLDGKEGWLISRISAKSIALRYTWLKKLED